MRGRKRTVDQSLVNTLRNVPIFHEVTDEGLAAITHLMKEVSFPVGTEISREGAAGVGLHIIVQGNVRVEVGGNIQRSMGPGSFFGEISVLDGGPRSATVTAESDVVTLSLVAWDLRTVLSNYPDVAVKMLEELCRRVRENDDNKIHH